MPRGRKAYANRTDLNNPKVAVNAPTGMPYGENKALRDAQKAVPMGNPEMAQAPASTPTAAPVKPIPLTQFTDRPNENIMTGVTTPVQQPGNQDLQKLKSFQGIFEAEAQSDDAPQTFRDFVEWLRYQ